MLAEFCGGHNVSETVNQGAVDEPASEAGQQTTNSADASESLRLEEHVLITAKATVAVDALAAATPLSKQKIKRAMQAGAVWLTPTGSKATRRLRRAKRGLRAGDELHLYYDSRLINSKPPAPTLIADEGEYSVWYKPSGLLSQGSKWGDEHSIARWAEQQLQPQRQAFIVHRLDRAASGLILLAHGKRAAAALSALFQERTVTKNYRATVLGLMPNESPLPVFDEPIDGKVARSIVLSIEQQPELQQTQLLLSIETGRKHQIRRHLAEAGYPIVGDRLYGEPPTGGNRLDLQLCAVELSFTCPLNGQARCYTAKPTEPA